MSVLRIVWWCGAAGGYLLAGIEVVPLVYSHDPILGVGTGFAFCLAVLVMLEFAFPEAA